MTALLTSNFPGPGNEAVVLALKSMVANPHIAWIAPNSEAGRWETAQKQFGAYGLNSLTQLTHLEVAESRLEGRC